VSSLLRSVVGPGPAHGISGAGSIGLQGAGSFLRSRAQRVAHGRVSCITVRRYACIWYFQHVDIKAK